MTSRYSNARILVVDDHTLTATSTAMLLESMLGIPKVETAKDGEDAWHKLQTQMPYDLVITDNDMPKMNGEALIRKIRADRVTANTPIIAVTADDLSEQRLRNAGADYFCRKESRAAEEILAFAHLCLDDEFPAPADQPLPPGQ